MGETGVGGTGATRRRWPPDRRMRLVFLGEGGGGLPGSG